MRKIKFRAWDKKLKSMAKVISLSFYDEYSPCRGNETESFLYYEKLDTTSLRSFDEIELMQYTGLKDKNGVEIYEGDIIRVYEVDREEELDYTAPVVWKDLGWVVLANENLDMPLFTLDDSRDWVGSVSEIEVIGNIHDNPDLISNS